MLQLLRAEIIRAIDALIFPWACVICHGAGEQGPFCEPCRQKLLEASRDFGKASCPRCGLRAGPFADLHDGCSACRSRRLGFDATIAFGRYEGALRDICLMLKQDRNAWLGPWLADLFVESCRDRLEAAAGDAIVVPVPLHWRRRWERGYNQAEVLARRLALRLKRPCHLALKRVIATSKLAPMAATTRRATLRDAFAVRSSRLIAGRAVILVDDVMTTGATCASAARILKRAGAHEVRIAVMARTDRPRY